MIQLVGRVMNLWPDSASSYWFLTKLKFREKFREFAKIKFELLFAFTLSFIADSR